MSVKPRKSEFNKKGVAFGLELYNNVRAISKPTNTVLSPVSIHLALGLTYMGASGETQREMKRVLRLEDDKTLTGKSFYGVLCKYQKNPNIVIANKLYVQQGFEIKAEMNQAAKKWFKSEIEAVDFSEQASAAETVNKWIKEKTGGKITDIVNQDAFEPNTVLILLNALYFKCNWKHPFDMNTEEGHFWLNDGESMKVTMMKQRSMKASYAEFGDLDSIAVQLPFADEDLSMLILLPNNKTGLDALEAKLVGLDLPQRRKQMMQETVKITMPLFRVEFEQNLNDALKKMGLASMFNTNDANFSELIEDGGDNFFVSKVVHKTFIDVNTGGVEAAAATTVEIVPRVSPELPKDILVDHPFLFALFSKKHRLFFVGSIRNPQDKM